MPYVAEILQQSHRKWSINFPANEDDILRVIQASPITLPVAYLDLLRFSNGGEGELALSPRWFVLFDVNEVLGMLKDNFFRDEFPGFMFFGGNGGGEQMAFDLRKGEPYPIVMIDPIAGLESAEEIVPDMAQFIEAIGIEYPEG